jgi:hypothetical protein
VRDHPSKSRIANQLRKLVVPRIAQPARDFHPHRLHFPNCAAVGSCVQPCRVRVTEQRAVRLLHAWRPVRVRPGEGGLRTTSAGWAGRKGSAAPTSTVASTSSPPTPSARLLRSAVRTRSTPTASASSEPAQQDGLHHGQPRRRSTWLFSPSPAPGSYNIAWWRSSSCSQAVARAPSRGPPRRRSRRRSKSSNTMRPASIHGRTSCASTSPRFG